MKTSSLPLVICLIVLVLLSAACVMAQMPAPTPELNAAYTASIQTIVAELTQPAPALADQQAQVGAENTQVPTVELPIPSEFVLTDTPLPTVTPQPSSTLDFTATPLPTATIEPSATPEPTETPTETPLPVLVFKDNFSSRSGWIKETGENYGFDFVNGGYQIFVKIKEVPIWSVRTYTDQDVQLEVDALEVDKSKGGYWGLVCRQTSGANYYAFLIGSDGFFGIAKKGNGLFTFIKQGGAPVEANLSKDDFNHIRADCIGNTLSLYVNDILLAEVQDKDYMTGNVGMVVGSRSRGTVTVLFDNFVVYSPK